MYLRATLTVALFETFFTEVSTEMFPHDFFYYCNESVHSAGKQAQNNRTCHNQVELKNLRTVDKQVS